MPKSAGARNRRVTRSGFSGNFSLPTDSTRPREAGPEIHRRAWERAVPIRRSAPLSANGPVTSERARIVESTSANRPPPPPATRSHRFSLPTDSTRPRVALSEGASGSLGSNSHVLHLVLSEKKARLDENPKNSRASRPMSHSFRQAVRYFPPLAVPADGQPLRSLKPIGKLCHE